MHQERLAALIERPEVQQMILGNYAGGYSLGLTSNPEDRGTWAIRVRIEGDDAIGIAQQVTLEGNKIPVIVNTNFRVPTPLGVR